MVYSITLDLQKANSQYILTAIQGDSGNKIQATFANAPEGYLDGKTVVFAALKPDGKFVYGSTVIDGNTATYTDEVESIIQSERYGQLCTASGVVHCSFIILEDQEVKYSPQFLVVVHTLGSGTFREALQSNDDLSALCKLVGRIEYDLANDVFKGDPGEQGVQGEQGVPGVSCTHSWDGTVLSVTSASGTSSADLKGEKGDTGAAKITSLVPYNNTLAEPDTESAEYSALAKGEMFYTYDSTAQTHLFFVKVDNDFFLRVGSSGSERLTVVPVTTDYQGNPIPNVNTKEFLMLRPGQMFLCETETEVYKRWVKSGVASAYDYENDVASLTPNKMELVPTINDPSLIAYVPAGQLFRTQGRLYLRSATGAIPITTETEIPVQDQ